MACISNYNQQLNLEVIPIVFKSKVDLWLAVIVWGCALASFTPALHPDGRLAGLIIGTITSAIIAFLWFNTKYVIDGETLVIKGIIRDTNIPIESIRTVSPTRNPISAPALSIDRIEIIYGPNGNMAIISPKERKKFYAMLTAVNENIAILE